MIKSNPSAADTELGIFYDMSSTEKGGKQLMYPDSLGLDGSYNLFVLSEREGMVYK